MGEKNNIINFNHGLKLRDQKDDITIGKIQEGISILKEEKSQLEGWLTAATEEGDQKSILLYEAEILEIDMLILDGEILCDDLENEKFERWQKYLSFREEKELEEDLKESIELELDSIADYLEFLLEESDGDSEDEAKIIELQKRQEELEKQRMKFFI